MTKYLIIGNSAGGIAAAEAIREIDKEGALTIVSDEPYPAYSRPLISEYLASEKSINEMYLRGENFYQDKNIIPLLNKKVTGIDLENHLAMINGSSSLPWEKLLLACGGKPIIPPINGVNKRGVLTFTTLEDAEKIKEALEWARKIVVIGGGLIGISVTDALVKKGTEVIVVELQDRVLSTILDRENSHVMEKKLHENKVRVITRRQVIGILGRPMDDDTLGGVMLDDGEEISCYLVIIAIGVTPRIELVSGMPIKVNRGIVVDRQMRTAHPDVYACGDAAEAFDLVYSADRVTPIWPNAALGGRVAGLNMAGASAVYPGGTSLNTIKYFGFSLVSAGIVEPPANDGYQILKKYSGKGYRKIVLKDGHIVGMLLNGDVSKAGIIYGLMKDQTPVGAFKEALLEDSLSLADLPQAVRNERLQKEFSLSGAERGK